MNGVFARISPNGSRMMSGDTELWIDGRLYRENAISGDWLDNEVVLYRNHTTGHLYKGILETGNYLPICPDTTWVECENGRFVFQHMRNNKPEIHTSDGRIFKDFGGAMRSCSINSQGGVLIGRNVDGRMFYVPPYAQVGEELPIIGISPWVTDTHAYVEKDHQIYQIDLVSKRIHNISLEEYEYWPIVRGEWICYHTSSRLIVRKLGTNFGHVVAEGHTFCPHFVLTEKDFVIAWTGLGKELGVRKISRDMPLEDVSIPKEISHPSGTIIQNPIEFFNVKFHRTKTHPLGGFPDGEGVTYMKFNDPNALERYEWKDGQIRLVYDNTDGRNKPWRLEPNIWVHQDAKVGDVREYDARLIRANMDGTFNDTHKFPYKIYIRSLTDNVKLPFGYAQVLTLEFILNNNYKERFHYARKYGWFKWELIQDNQYKQVSIFDEPYFSLVTPGKLVNIPDPPVISPPIEEKPPMPIYFDAEYDELVKFLDKKYEVDLKRDPQTIYVDSTGLGRWVHDYIRERDKGATHVGAIQTINKRINQIVGLPESQSPIPFPEYKGGLKGKLNFKDGWRDGEDYALPVFCHFGEGFSLWCRDTAKAKEALEEIAKAGYDGIRVWITLNVGDNPISYWEGRGVSPRYTPNYYAQLRAFIIYCFEKHNLRVHLACGDLSGFSNEEETELFTKLSELLDTVPDDAIGMIEVLNEARDTGDVDERDPKELERLVNLVRLRHPDHLYSLTAYTGTEEYEDLSRFTPPWMPFFLVHGYRGGHIHDKIRHIFSLTYEKPVRLWGWQGEPTGPGKWVSATENKHELTEEALSMMACMSYAAGQVWTYMSSPGVIYDESFLNMPGFYALPTLVKLILPPDITSWLNRFHGGESFAHKRIYAVPGRDETRADHIMAPDGRFVIFLYGPRWRECRKVRDCEIRQVYDFGSTGQIIVGKV